MTGRTPDDAPPTRRAIVDLLAGSPRGMTAAEIAGAVGLHANAIRKQLRALVREGSVGAERELSGRRGRPAVRYRAADERREAAATRRLTRMLLDLVAELGPDEAAVEDFGRRQAPALAAVPGGRAALMGLLTALGFSPRETTPAASSRAGGLEVVLGHCPFRDVVEGEDGRLVCVLHRGISRGLVEMDPAGRLTAFEIRPPATAGCRIGAEGLAPPSG